MHCRLVAICRLVSCGLLVSLAGCAGLTRQQQQTFRIPPPNSQREYPPGIVDRGSSGGGSAPLGAQSAPTDPATVLRIEPRKTEGQNPQSALPGRTPVESDGPGSGGVGKSPLDLEPPERGAREVPRQTPGEPAAAPETEGGLSLPEVEFEALVPQGELELEASSVEQSAVGQLTTFHVLLRNATPQPAENLKVLCKLGEGLRFPGSEERELEAGVARLEPGETKEWDLSLLGTRKGEHCCRFELLSDDQSHSARRPEQRVCVKFVERQFSLEMMGPRQRPVGTQAEFLVLVRNPGSKTLQDVILRVGSDKAITPQALTEGAHQGNDGVTWDLGSLEPGESRQVQVEFACEREAQRAVVRAEIEAEGVALQAEERVLRIDAAKGPLVVELRDQSEPLVVGNRGQLEFSVKNVGLETARRLAVGLKLPRELGVLSARVKRGGTELSTNFSVRDERVEFDLIDELEPDQVLTGVLEVEALDPGRLESWLDVRSSLNRQPATSGEWTLVEPR
ncbi:MAG: hypothetical protein ACK50P_21965 [Planctomycetaceae bacterium]